MIKLLQLGFHHITFIHLYNIQTSLPSGWQFGVQEKLSLNSILSDGGEPAASATGPVSPDRLGHHLQNQLLTILLLHLLLEHVIHHTIQEAGARSSNTDRLTDTHSTHRHCPHLATLALVIISGNNKTSHQTVSVLVSNLLERPGSVSDGCRTSLINLHEVEPVLDDVRDGLGVRGGAGPAAEDVVRDGGELVRDPVGYPRAHAGPAVRPNHHSAIKLYCTQSCSRGHLFTSGKPVGRKSIFAHSGKVLERCNGCHCCLLK